VDNDATVFGCVGYSVGDIVDGLSEEGKGVGNKVGNIVGLVVGD